VVLRFDGASVSVTGMSKIAVVPQTQNLWTAMSPQSSWVGLVPLVPATCTSQLVWMRGLSETVKGVRA
jgi:hypothetical protein